MPSCAHVIARTGGPPDVGRHRRWAAYVSPADSREHPGLLHDGAVHGPRKPDRLISLLGDDSSRLAAAADEAAADPLDVVAEAGMTEARITPAANVVPLRQAARDRASFSRGRPAQSDAPGREPA